MGDDQKGPTEKDIMALKGALEAKDTELGALKLKLDEAMSAKDTSLSELAKARTALEQLNTEVKGLKEAQQKLTDLEQKLKASGDASGKLAERLTVLKRRVLVEFYGASEDIVKDKNLEQLDTLEEALRVVGKKPSRFDVGGGGGQTSNLSEDEKLAKRYPRMTAQLQKT